MNRWATHPQLGGASVGIHRPKIPSVGEPRLDVGKEPYVGEMGEAELAPVPPPPHRRTQI
jgi:hypothetical protein